MRVKYIANRITVGFASLFLFLNMLQGLNVKVLNGSGVLIGQNRVLTASHLLHTQKEFSIGIDGKDVAGKLIKKNQMGDLALIEVVGKYRYVKKLKLNLQLGDKVYIPCNAGILYEDIVFTGRIAKIEKNEIILQTTIMPGMSGAGVFDRKGNLVGLLIQGYGHDQIGNWIALVVPAWQIKEFMEE